MDRRILSRAQVRLFDQLSIDHFGIHPLVLMENAARGAVDALCEFEINGEVLIVCGRGNNGGDGLAMARHLHLRGYSTRVILLADEENLSKDSQANLRILTSTTVPISLHSEINLENLDFEFEAAEWIVDAMLGTGASPPVREPLNRIIPMMNAANSRRMAVDIPTGLDCEVDLLAGPVFEADLTCTFVAMKPVMKTETGHRYCGHIKILDIGAPPEVFDLLES